MVNRFVFLIGIILVGVSGCIASPTSQDYCTVHFCLDKVVSGHSMEPTIFSGDKIRIAIDYYQFFPLQRGDIIIVDFNVDGNLRVKRLVGLAGDNVHLTDEGDLAVNEKVILAHPPQIPFTPASFPIFTFPFPVEAKIIPLDKVMVISDNATAGFDSLDYGFIDSKFIIGKVIEIIPSPKNDRDVNESNSG